MRRFYLYIKHPNTLEQYIGSRMGMIAALREFKKQQKLFDHKIEMVTYMVGGKKRIHKTA